MNNIQHIKDKNAVLVPIKDWEKLQKELARLRKRIKKATILTEIRAAVVALEKDIKNGAEAKGKDAREFVSELLDEQ